MKTIEQTVKLLQEGDYAIHMDRKEPQDIELLKKVLKLAFPLDTDAFGDAKYYYKNGVKTWTSGYTDLPNIKITQITDSEHFENGEEVEVSDERIEWQNMYYIGKSKDGLIVVESKDGAFTTWNFVRKLNPERTKAIETIKELREKFNVKSDEI
jgi:hypothetical protein